MASRLFIINPRKLANKKRDFVTRIYVGYFGKKIKRTQSDRKIAQ